MNSRFTTKMENKNNIRTTEKNEKDRHKICGRKCNVLCNLRMVWTGSRVFREYPEEFHDAIWSQGAIGWRQVFNGRISKLWLEHQGNTKLASGRVRMDYIWGASIVETCLRMMLELWELRNDEVQGKEEAAIEHKRKERAAMTVWELHKLEEHARPSDSNLFYQDVEETKERVTAPTSTPLL